MIGYMTMPSDFRYKKVYQKGQPRHERFDSFRLVHPCMELSKRAKIFAPFDALRGFSELISGFNGPESSTSGCCRGLSEQ